MAANSKDSRMQSRLEKVARESGDVGAHYEVEARAVREKMARLRALRLAKEAADKAAIETGLQAKPAKAEKKSARIAARRT
jgi:hypothetical protein